MIKLLFEARKSRHAAACSVPIIAVIGITLLRLLSGADLVASLPFTTYFPAIVVTALLGGLRPGVVAILLVSMIAWYPTIPDEFGSRAALWFLLMVLVTAVNILVVALLSAAVDLLINRVNQQESAK